MAGDVLFVSDLGETAGDEGQRSWILPVFLGTALVPRGAGGPGLRWLLEVLRQLRTGLVVLALGKVPCWTWEHLKQLCPAAYSGIHTSSDQGKSHLYACMVYFHGGLN